MGQYHNRIMSLKPVRSMAMFVDKQAYDHYHEGYARALKHASEIALEAEREIEELKDALAGLDEAYCRAGAGLTREERFEDRKRLMRARKALSNADKD